MIPLPGIRDKGAAAVGAHPGADEDDLEDDDGQDDEHPATGTPRA